MQHIRRFTFHMFSAQKKQFLINTHQAHNFFWALKKILFFEIFLQIPLDLQRDIDRKMKFFKNPKLSVYYMCHMCANQFYDFESATEWYCLKKFNFESIHIRHINFFEFWKIWFFDQYPIVNPAEFSGKFHFFFFFKI